jgi:hypothetical protein
MQTRKIDVYIRINERNEVIEINSAIFLTDISGWIKIDEGVGDRYAHAQGHYFEKPLTNDNGTYNYRYQNGVIVSNN